MNQSELNALLDKTVLIRGGEHFCCAVGNDRLLLLQWCDSLAYKRHPIRENRMGKVRMALKMLGSVGMLNNN